MEAESGLASISFYNGYHTGVSVQNETTKLELRVGLIKIKSGLGAYAWKVKDNKNDT